MTVLHILGSARDGGAETYFLDLVRALHAEEGDQAAALRAHPGREAALEAAGVPLATAPFGGPLDLRTAPRLRRFACDEEAKVVVAWMNRAARFAPRSAGPRVGRLGGYYDLKYYRGFDHLVANTGDIGDWLRREGWPADRLSVIPNFAEPAPGPAAPRAPLDTPEGAPLLLAMSRLHPAKGLDVLLRAMARLPGAWLWIAGSGPLEAELRALSQALGVDQRVRFLGWRADASALYRAADLTVFPSRFEPLGNTVIQAWAHGSPVVAAAAQGPSVLIEDGEDGLLVPVEDDEALAVAVDRVLASPALAERLAEAGRARVIADFSRPAVLARWRELFARLAPP